MCRLNFIQFKAENIRKCLITALLTFFIFYSNANEINILWQKNDNKIAFSDAAYFAENSFLPTFSLQLKGKWKNPVLNNISTENADANSWNSQQKTFISTEFEIKTFHGKMNGEWLTTFQILPIRLSGANFELLSKASLSAEQDFDRNNVSLKRINTATTSALSSGNWYKIGVPIAGVYKLDYDFLDKLGLGTNINPSQIKIFGQKGGMLPEQAGAERVDDVKEVPLKVVNPSGGWQKGDYVLVYLEGPETWYYDNSKAMFRQTKHLYSNFKGYFVTTDGGAGKRITQLPPETASEDRNINTFDDYQFFEEDINNLNLSGKLWIGNEFSFDNQINLNFNFNNIVSSEPAKALVGVVGKSGGNSSTFEIKSNGTTLRTLVTLPTGFSDIADVAKYADGTINLNNPSSTVNVQVVYNRPDFDSKGWLDFVTVNAKRNLIYDGNPLYFRALNSVGVGTVSRFNIQGLNSGTQVWDITDFFETASLPLQNGNFKTNTSTLKQFVAVENTSLVPQAFGKIPNQNLHALNPVEYIIVTRKSMKSQADDLGNFHAQKEGYSYVVVDIEEIFNEFSSGNNDVTAIRDFVKMMYDRANAGIGDAPKFLLLFGDGTYDNKNLGEFLLPTFQSVESLETVKTYVTDDYFALLDDNEGINITNTATNLVDIGVGRFCADNITKANVAVQKIKRYYNSYGDWRNQVTFVADDEDGIIHVKDANEVADIIQNNYLKYNVEKIYLDAYRQQSAAGGSRYPDVNRAIAEKLFTGTFLWSYAGHGGTSGLAEERILTFEEINNWNNPDKLPVFSTATCELTRFDEPAAFTAGERIFCKENGGAIALVTTTRLVFAFENRITNENFTRELMKAAVNGKAPLGEILMKSKVITNTFENNRKFSLIGDPALSLAIPQKDVFTTSLTTEAASGTQDTVKALSRVKLKGEVRNNGNILTDFNGEVSIIIFDKMSTITTLRNDPKSGAYTFKAAKNIVYRGRARVVNGAFSTTFIVPKDINYNIGNGKISYYADNGTIDAAGYDSTVVIGGISDSIPKDNQGPEVNVFMDDESFAFGGTASPNSSLLVRLADESGINTSGAGLGHDITAIIDEDSKSPIILNAFYESELDDFTQGKVVYPFSELAKGRHTLRVKAWDVLNNSGEGYTEFIVENDENLALYYVLNYPNPFTTSTKFSFEHNRPGDNLDVRVEIFTVSGKIVKTIQLNVDASTRRVSDISWDGMDDFGDRLARGVYIYRVTVKDSSGNKTSKFQKLVLLK